MLNRCLLQSEYPMSISPALLSVLVSLIVLLCNLLGTGPFQFNSKVYSYCDFLALIHSSSACQLMFIPGKVTSSCLAIGSVTWLVNQRFKPSSRQRGRYKITKPQLSTGNFMAKEKLITGHRWVPDTRTDWPTDFRS
jgi:hypothetical protein